MLTALGRDGVAELVDKTCLLARRDAGDRVLNHVVFEQVVVDFGDPGRAGAVIRAVRDEETCWCGPTTWRGRKASDGVTGSWPSVTRTVSILTLDAFGTLAASLPGSSARLRMPRGCHHPSRWDG